MAKCIAKSKIGEHLDQFGFPVFIKKKIGKNQQGVSKSAAV